MVLAAVARGQIFQRETISHASIMAQRCKSDGLVENLDLCAFHVCLALC